MSLLNQMSAPCREYRLTSGRKFGQTLLAAGWLIGAAFFFKLAANPIGREFPLVVGVIFLAPGILLLLRTWRSRLILERDGIELHSAFRVHRARRDEIEGLRTIRNQYGCWTRVYLRQDRGAFNVSDSFTGDFDLKEWLKGIPDLDQRDAGEIEKAVGSLDSPALLPADSSNVFDRAKRWAIGLNVLAGAISIPVIWVSYEPAYRAALALLLACAPVAIILLHCFPLLFTVFRRKPDPRADLGFLLFWPGVAMMFSYQTANDPSHLVNHFELLSWALIILAAFVATLFQIASKSPSRGAAFLFVVLLGGAYSVGLVNALNTLPDRSEPRLYQTSILKLETSYSSKTGTSYYLHVAPWGPVIYPDQVGIPKRTYYASHVGDPVCLGLHPGVLRAPWYTTIPCTARNFPAIP